MQEFIEEIKQKKELSTLSNKFIEIKLNEKLKKSELELIKTTKFSKKDKKLKELVKKSRAYLREIYGVFQIKTNTSRNNIINKYKKLIENKQNNNNEKTIKINTNNIMEESILKLLKTHSSTNERIDYYKEIFNILKENIKLNKLNILDIGCGLNPLSYFYLQNCFNLEYNGTDISEEDMIFLTNCFKLFNFKGNFFQEDFSKVSNDSKIYNQHYDLTICFKVFDSIETQNWNKTYEIIKSLNSKYILVSFPKLSLGGKNVIKKSKRKWFNKFLEEQKYKVNEFEIPNEYFYLIEK